jgi:cell division protein FtsB
MKRLIEKRYVMRRNMLAVIGVCLSIYFAYHLIAGQRGYLRLMTLEYKVAEATEHYHNVKAEREAVETKVVMMRPGSIDRDLLEERVRYVLGYRYSNEYDLLQDRL